MSQERDWRKGTKLYILVLLMALPEVKVPHFHFARGPANYVGAMTSPHFSYPLYSMAISPSCWIFHRHIPENWVGVQKIRERLMGYLLERQPKADPKWPFSYKRNSDRRRKAGNCWLRELEGSSSAENWVWEVRHKFQRKQSRLVDCCSELSYLGGLQISEGSK